MNFESAFLGPQSIQVCHLRSKTPLTSVNRLRGPPRRSNVDRIFANHPFPTLCSPRPFAGREEWATRRGARRPPLLRAPPRPWILLDADIARSHSCSPLLQIQPFVPVPNWLLSRFWNRDMACGTKASRLLSQVAEPGQNVPDAKKIFTPRGVRSQHLLPSVWFLCQLT